MVKLFWPQHLTRISFTLTWNISTLIWVQRNWTPDLVDWLFFLNWYWEDILNDLTSQINSNYFINFHFWSQYQFRKKPTWQSCRDLEKKKLISRQILIVLSKFQILKHNNVETYLKKQLSKVHFSKTAWSLTSGKNV